MVDSGRDNDNQARRAIARTRLENAVLLIERLELWLAELKRTDPGQCADIIAEVEDTLVQVRSEIDALIK